MNITKDTKYKIQKVMLITDIAKINYLLFPKLIYSTTLLLRNVCK